MVSSETTYDSDDNDIVLMGTSMIVTDLNHLILG